MRRLLLLLLTLTAACALAPSALGAVLRVGSYRGIPGQYKSIQAAVNAAKPGDWILIGPGDYKTTASSIHAPKGEPTFQAGILITTPDLHIRGMNRNTVIVDGTKPGSAVCSNKESAQNFGPAASDPPVGGYGVIAAAGRTGANGVMVYKADNVSVENLTSCNFLGGSAGDGHTGNEIWWNGGADSGKVGGYGFYGSYLTGTSTFFKNETTAAEYGIFSSNWSGGTWDQTYTSNMNDSGYYIGACRQVCDQIMNHAWGEYSALGYSGSNSGGKLIVENSQFDNNQDGFDTNSQNGDEPSPQNGACPNNGISPITHTHSCWVFIHNYVHNNNNPNVPNSGGASAGPTGSGMSISGGRNDTVMDNLFANNDAWGIVFIPYPDSGPPCYGGILNFPVFGKGSCYFEGWGRALIDNRFSNNGSYGHPSNGDFAEVNLEGGLPLDCFRGNTQVGGGPLTPDAAALQAKQPDCVGNSPAGVTSNPPAFLTELLCDTRVGGAGSCLTGPYPLQTHVVMHPLPKHLPTMPYPCTGVPSNPWCARTSGFG
ncbi:MAG: hypothetical protein ACLPTJ_04575 [Solirubrobacteraceae bacterium]